NGRPFGCFLNVERSMLNVECSTRQGQGVHSAIVGFTFAVMLLFTSSLTAQTTNVVRPALRLRAIVPRVASTNSAVSATTVRATATTPVTPEVQVPLPATIELPPGVEPPLNNLPGFAPGGTNATAKAKTPEEKQLQDLLKLKFDRSASSILDALAEQMNEKGSTNA